MKFHNNLVDTLKIAPGPWPISKMILSTFSIAVPLVIGSIAHQFLFSMFGSLLALALILNDHFGDIKKRIQHIIVVSLFIISGYLLGSLAWNNYYFTYIILFIGTFLLGKVKNLGLELERVILFAILYFIAIAESPELKSQFKIPLYYLIFGTFNYIFFIYVVEKIKSINVTNIQAKRKILKKSILAPNNFFALFFACTTILTLRFSQYLELKKTFWVTGTVLIVMLPETHASFQKSFQRFLGTVIGAFAAVVLLYFFNKEIELIILVSIFAALLPLGLAKNYWIGNINIAALIIIFVYISPTHESLNNIAILRIKDISLGCIIAPLSILIYSFIQRVFNFKKNRE